MKAKKRGGINYKFDVLTLGKLSVEREYNNNVSIIPEDQHIISDLNAFAHSLDFMSKKHNIWNTPNIFNFVVKNNVKSTNYEVIVGSFSSENNAKKLIKKLRKKSFKARQLALIENFFRVSIGDFNKKENALKFQKQIKKKFKISSWILAN